MRPKKVILLLFPDETRLHLTGYMLEVNGYRTLRAPTVPAALALLASSWVDGALVDFGPAWPLAGCDAVKAIKRLSPHARVALVASPTTEPIQLFVASGGADRVIALDATGADLLDHMRLLTASKRGPLPRSPLVAVAAAGATAAVEVSL